jgi:murein DD-endopeptidase MepM/ murein hydrolase activator NlpD
MRRRLLPAVVLVPVLVLAAPVAASADTGGAVAPSGGSAAGGGDTTTGGASFQRGPLLRARRFSVAPRTVVSGAALTLRWRVDGRARRATMRVYLRDATGRTVTTLGLGRRRTHRSGRFSWKPKLTPGTYVARLRATAVQARHTARVSSSSTVTVAAPPVTAPAAPSASGIFPVQGAFSFGGTDARFGAPRSGHVHQGQDIVAAAGLPVVTPVAGSVYWVAYQAGGAGYYVVVRGADGRDYVFMHLQEGSTIVEKGQPVRAGQQLGRVGSTGESTGPHLHFEIWPDGWYATGSEPIDPLPQLQAWAAAR